MERSAMKPRLWQWYAHLSSGDVFQIVRFETSSGKIDVKYFDGTLRSIYQPAWDALALELRDPPEDWTDPVCEVPDASGSSQEQDRHAQERMHSLQGAASGRKPRVHADKHYEEAVWFTRRKSASTEAA